ncbi:MAG: family 16 glycosylhydrolase [Bacteroidota bacterium]
MKTSVYVLGVLSFFMLMLPWRAAQAQNWELVWADEFNGTEVDTSKWSFQIGDGCPDLCGWGNGEEQYYTAENATVEDGMLRITALEDSVGGRAYTSARLRTKGKAEWTYGRIELRAKLTRTNGFWPAVWMLPTDEQYGGWAASGEIDILEVFGREAATVHGTVHYGGESPKNTFSGGSWTLPRRDFSRAFHDFAIEWVPGEIRWYADGNLYHIQNEWYTTEARFPAPFDQQFHLLVNVAVGGAGGVPDASSRFPQSMEIDYIRVYQSENVAPSIVLDAPVGGAVQEPGSDVRLQASPTDPDGLISRVLFYAGDALVAEVDTAPYEATISSVSEGCYTLRAQVIDNLGGKAWSEETPLTVGSCVQAPYGLVPVAVPGRLQAEHFDLGGAQEAYRDLDATNAGNALGHTFRPDEGVDIDYALGSEQGFFVRDFEAEEWLEYQIAPIAAGAFNIDLRARTEGGATVSLFADSTLLARGVAIEPSGQDGFATVRVPNLTLDDRVQTLRVQADAGRFELDYITLTAYTEPPAEGTFLVEDFTDQTGAAWNYFGSVEGMVTTGDGLNPFLRATFSGSGGAGEAFYGVMWNNFPDDNQVVIPADPWFNVRIRHASAATTVNRYAFEITVREDTNGDGWDDGEEDSHRFDAVFDPRSFNDEWISLSIPLSTFMDLQTGGNGILEGSLDEVVFVVSQVVGPDPSSVQVDLDDIILSSGRLSTSVPTIEPLSSFELYRPYPDPTAGIANVVYNLDEPSPVALYVYDLLGRRVLQSSMGVQATGTHRHHLDLSGVSAGVYFIRLTAGGRVQTRTVVVAR